MHEVSATTMLAPEKVAVWKQQRAKYALSGNNIMHTENITYYKITDRWLRVVNQTRLATIPYHREAIKRPQNN